MLKYIFKKSSFLLIARVFSIALSLFFSIYAARKMGSMEFGRFSLIFSMVSFFLTFSGAELQSLLVRDIAHQKHRSSEYLATAIVFKLLVTFFSIILLVFLSKIINKGDILMPLSIAVISLIPACVYDAFEAVFRGYEKVEFIAITGILYSILKTCIGIFLLFYGVGLVALFVGLLFAEFFKTFLVFVFYQRRINSFCWKIDKEILKYLFKESYILVLIKGGLGLIYYRADIILLSALIGDIAVGKFSISTNLIGLLSMVSAIIISTVLPVITQWYHTDRNKMLKALCVLTKCALLIFIPVIAFLSIFSKPIIQLFYGKEYLDVAPLLVICAWDALFCTFLGLQGVVLLVSNKYRQMSNIITFVVILKVVVSYVLIARYGLTGAAISYSLCDCFALFIYHFYTPNELRDLYFSKESIRILFSLIVFIVMLYLSKPMGIIAGFVFAFISYGITTFLLGIFNIDEVTFITNEGNLNVF